jgi:hypothetical protein
MKPIFIQIKLTRRNEQDMDEERVSDELWPVETIGGSGV